MNDKKVTIARPGMGITPGWWPEGGWDTVTGDPSICTPGSGGSGV